MGKIQENLQTLGIKNTRERTRWLKEHKDEIITFLKAHGTRATRREFHVGHGVLRRWGIISSKPKPVEVKVKKSPQMLELKAQKPEIEAYLRNHTWDETCAKFHHDIRTLKKLGLRRERQYKPKVAAEAVSVEDKQLEDVERFLDMLLLIPEFLRQFIQKSKKFELLEKQIADIKIEVVGLKKQPTEIPQSNNVHLEEQIKKLKEQQSQLEAYIRVIIACFTDALDTLGLKKGLQIKMTLPDLQHFKGYGPRGDRRSFQPEHHYNIEVVKIKPQKPQR